MQDHPPDSMKITLPNRSLPSQKIEGAKQTHQQPTVHELPEYDVIIIGGGINGTAIAMDAATRASKESGKAQSGLRVLLVEKDDFGAKTSATSSRLAHGGFRYLASPKTTLASDWEEEQHQQIKKAPFGAKLARFVFGTVARKEVDLVHESLQERERLLQNAPHLVRPLPSVLPIYSSNKHGKLKVKIGLMAYDALSYHKSMPNHQLLNKQEMLKRFPGLNPKGLQGGFLYYDAQANLPERLCVENAIAAKESGNASIINHAEVTGIDVRTVAGANREAAGVTFKDLLTGEEYSAKGKVIINASGPWVDELLTKLPKTEATAAMQQRMGGTKGSHVVVKKFPINTDKDTDQKRFLEHGLYVEAQSDGRPMFILPWQDDYYLIGTTDDPYNGDLNHITANQDEIQYLLDEVNLVLPHGKLKPEDVLYTFAGVRPLPHEPGKSAGEITRKHIIEDHAHDPQAPIQRLVSIIGGKITTARNLAEEAVDYIISTYQLKLPSGEAVGRSQTRNMSLPGGLGIENLQNYKAAQVPYSSKKTGLSERVIGHLIDLYGGRYQEVLKLAQENPHLKKPLFEDSLDIGAQVVYAVRNEMATTLSDVLLRRTASGLQADIGLKAAEPAAKIMAAELDWDAGKTQQEIEDYRLGLQIGNLAFKQE